MLFQMTMLPNDNVCVAVVGDECPSHEEKMALAQFRIGETIELGGKKMIIEGMTMRPFKGTAVALTVWHICYYLKDVNKPEGNHSAPELEVLMTNVSPRRLQTIQLIEKANNERLARLRAELLDLPQAVDVPTTLGWNAEA